MLVFKEHLNLKIYLKLEDLSDIHFKLVFQRAFELEDLTQT